MKLLDVITEDPVEKIDILKQFAKDAPIPPKKSGPVSVKSAVTPASKSPVKKSVTLEATGLGAQIEQAAKADGITGAHLANFMAQCKVETAGFKSLIEWSSGQQYEGRKDLGNTQPGDGERFKGRGFLHLTGRENYTRCNNDCGWRNTKLDIVRNPDLVATNLQIAVASALWYWNLFIRSNYKPTSIVAVSTRVNGTNPNGLNARINAFKDYCSKLGIRIQNIVAPVRKATKHAELDPTGDTQVASNDADDTVIQTDLAENQTEQFCLDCGGSLSEEGKASRALCTSGRPDSALGASQLASCKSQGLRARDGEKSHLITHGARKVRVTVGGKKIKGKRYGGPLPDYGTRKNQLSEDKDYNVLSLFEALSVPWSGRDPAFNDIQKALISIGYKDVAVTGILDKPTQMALIDFQKNNGLQTNGSANVETLKKLDAIADIISTNSSKTNSSNNKATTPVKTAPATNKPDPVPDTPTKPTKSSNATDPNIRPRIRNDMSSYANRTLIIKYFLEKKMDMIHIQGIMANMEAESKFDSGAYVAHDIATPAGLKPGTAEYAAWKTSAAYLKAGPSGGLCQWHDSKGDKRFTKMMSASGGEGAWQTNWQGQLDFLLTEPDTKRYLKEPFKTAQEASSWFTINWERPNKAEEKAETRIDNIKKRFFSIPGKE